MQSGLNLKPYETRIQRCIEKERTHFELDAPAKLTIKRRNGTFAKQPFIGGERFEITALYEGKRDGFIFVFRPLDPCDYAFMEMPLDQAQKSLAGFNRFLEFATGMTLAELTSEQETKRFQATVEEKIKENPAYAEIYGSW